MKSSKAGLRKEFFMKNILKKNDLIFLVFTVSDN